MISITRENFVQSLGQAINKQDVVNEVMRQNETLTKKYHQLRSKYNQLENMKVIQTKILTSNSKLSILLGTDGRTIVADLLDKQSLRKMVSLILQSYYLIDEILYEFGIIKEVNFTYMYLPKNGKTMGRVEATHHLDINEVSIDRASKQRGGAIKVRMKASTVKAMMKESQNELVQQVIAQHMKQFFQPYFDYQSHNKKGWKMNMGVATAAFERHWEQLSHSIDNPAAIRTEDLPSEGRRWLLYLQSSGNDPFYTGPDTLQAQVKNYNASLIDNIDTVLNAMYGIIQITENANNIENIADKIIKTFSQANNERDMKLSAIYDDLSQDVKNELQDLLQAQINQH